jgi:hypothetical protein
MSDGVTAAVSRARTKKTVTRVGIIGAGVIIAALAVTLLLNGPDDERRSILEDGVVTVGEPTGQAVESRERRDGSQNQYEYQRLKFHYVVDGKDYTALGDQRYRSVSFDLDKALEANATAEVRYLEDDPSQAIVLDQDYR